MVSLAQDSSPRPAFSKEVTLQTHGHDKYKRTIADVLLHDGSNVNHTLVRDDWCWWYRKYAPGDAVLEQLEKAAREAKKGLWADPQSVPPWVYRKARRGQTLDLSDFVQLENESESSGTSRGPPQLGAVEPKSSPDSTSSPYPVIGNRKSHNYHRPDCPNYSQVVPHNRVAFNSAAEAEEAGGIGWQGIVPADETSKVNLAHYPMHMRMLTLRYNHFPPNPCVVVRIPPTLRLPARLLMPFSIRPDRRFPVCLRAKVLSGIFRCDLKTASGSIFNSE